MSDLELARLDQYICYCQLSPTSGFYFFWKSCKSFVKFGWVGTYYAQLQWFPPSQNEVRDKRTIESSLVVVVQNYCNATAICKSYSGSTTKSMCVVAHWVCLIKCALEPESKFPSMHYLQLLEPGVTGLRRAYVVRLGDACWKHFYLCAGVWVLFCDCVAKMLDAN